MPCVCVCVCSVVSVGFSVLVLGFESVPVPRGSIYTTIMELGP